jgi:UDP-glucose:glycoprotein glucosyltransferase
MIPPRGLELVLGVPLVTSGRKGKEQDTIVMSNYGYFQLKANPGVWDVQLKANSRSHSIYQFVGGTSRIILDSFLGAFQRVMVITIVVQLWLNLNQVSKQPNKVHEQLLSEDSSVWNSISKYLHKKYRI